MEMSNSSRVIINYIQPEGSKLWCRVQPVQLENWRRKLYV